MRVAEQAQARPLFLFLRYCFHEFSNWSESLSDRVQYCLCEPIILVSFYANALLVMEKREKLLIKVIFSVTSTYA